MSCGRTSRPREARWRRERQHEQLRELLTWGLHTDDTPDEDGGARSGCGYDAVLRRAATVQLKAIAVAAYRAWCERGSTFEATVLEKRAS